jgi:PKD repeat protein
MKKFIFACGFILSYLSINSQNTYSPFYVPSKKYIDSRVESFVKNALIVDLDINQLREIRVDNSSKIKLNLPLGEERINNEVKLKKFNFLSDDFQVYGSHSGNVQYNAGDYYMTDQIATDGMGTISVYDDEIMGIISYPNSINYNIGRLSENTGKYIIFKDSDLMVNMDFDCHSEDNIRNEIIGQIERNRSVTDSKCIDIYLEADYALYEEKGKSMKKTVDFLLGLFAETVLLYRNEKINIKVSKIKVWETPDSYDTTSSYKALDQFVKNNQNSTTDLNMIIAYGAKGLGGLAYVNVLCNNSLHFAYSNIDIVFANIPAYSWSTMVITHELGHNLGSSHTHACRWNNDDTQIDDCGNVYLYNSGDTPEGKSCFDNTDPIIPLDGGTIMSYCHLIGVSGINLAKGFGEQPGNLIRKRVIEAECIESCEDYGVEKPIADFNSKSVLSCPEGEIQFNDISDNHPTSWKWIFEKNNGNDTSYHKYPIMKYENEGKYDVSLIATNAIGSDTITKYKYITVIDGPKADFTYEFIDAQTVQFKNSSINANKYYWKFGDEAISLGINPKHKYVSGGKYLVELRATRDTCNTHNYFTDTIEIAVPLKASILYNKNKICPGDSIYFQSASTQYDSVKWEFQGGHILTSTENEINILYPDSGLFDVKFIAFSQYGSDTLTKLDEINVIGKPEPEFEYINSSDTVFFHNNTLGGQSYIWSFGDSLTSTSLNPTHIYKSSGEYFVVLNATNQCFEDSIKKKVIVEIVGTNEFEDEEMLIFPNPSGGIFNISFTKDFLPETFEIYDISGKKINSQVLSEKLSDGNLNLNLSHLPDSIYKLKVSDGFKIFDRILLKIE